MSQTYTQVPPNSTGNKMDGWETTTAAQVRQTVVIGDPSTDDNVVAIGSSGRMPVESEEQLDYDTGAGSANLSLVGLALPASGGPVAGGTSSNPLQVSLANTGANGTAIVVDGSGVTQPVSIASTVTVDGSGVTQPVSIASTVTVDGSGVTQPVSATSLPLPTGAATSVKQPALGTAGSAASDVLTVQGIASMTALKVDGSATTQPVSGTVTVQQSTASSLKVDLSGTAANTTAIKVDGSAVTQPVSDGGGSLTVDGTVAVSGSVTVDGSGSTQPVSAAVGSPVFVTPTPSTTGGWSVNSQTALSSTAQSVKASAGTFGGYMVYNPNDAVSYVQVFDASSPTVGTDAPTYVIPIPASSAANVEFTNGIKHSTAIEVAATTSATGSTAPSTDLVGFFLFK